MEIKSLREFEITHMGTDYILDFDIYWYIESEPRTYDHPGSWDLIIDGYDILSANFYNEETDQWEKSSLTDNELSYILNTFHEETIKNKITA
jgi:hypothetical protein